MVDDVTVSVMGSIPSQRRMVLITGQTGSGKSTLARAVLRDKTRVLIADADFQEYGALDFTPPDGPGFDALIDYLKQRASTTAFYRVSYTPYEVEYPLMCELARELGPIDFVIEECDRFPDPKQCPEYEEIIGRGRHWGVSIMAISRHPFAIPVSFRREANRIFAFRHHEPRDIEWLRDVMGKAAEELPSLGDHEYLEWTPKTGTLPRRKLALK